MANSVCFINEQADKSMAQFAEYIKSVEIDSLWSGRRHVMWELRPDVNILSGVNGVGKSTILNRVVRTLLNTRSVAEIDRLGVKLTFGPEGADKVRFDVIRSFDRPFIPNEVIEKMVDVQLQSELDLQLYQLQRRYLDYQVNASKRIVDLFTQNAPDAQQQAQRIAGDKAHFQDVVDSLFQETGKQLDRDENEIIFRQMGERLIPYKLSSGEKQMLIILLTTLVQNHEPYVLLMDEPEISLHIDWQKKLIGLVRDLNPKTQIILTTHSPAVIMDGWMDCVTDVEDIVTN